MKPLVICLAIVSLCGCSASTPSTAHDASAAKGHFEQCVVTDVYCHWQEVAAAEKAGDAKGADAARTELLRAYRRDPVYLSRVVASVETGRVAGFKLATYGGVRVNPLLVPRFPIAEPSSALSNTSQT